MKAFRTLLPLPLAMLCGAVIFTLNGCSSGGGGGTTPPANPTITSVAVSPASANVVGGASQTFQATVTGTGDYSSAVNWSVNGVAGGSPSAGLITAQGVYTAPQTPPSPSTVTVKATSTEDSSKSGSGSATVEPPAYTITGLQITSTGKSLTVVTSSTMQFSAIVTGTGTFSTAVTWSVNNVSGGNATVGTIDASGLYTAPASVPSGGRVEIGAASVADPSVSNNVELTIVAAVTPVIQQIAPTTADAGEQIQITGSGFNAGVQSASAVTVVFSGVNGILVPVVISANTSDDTERTVTVPPGAADGPVYLVIQSLALSQSYTSNSVPFTRAPRIRIRAPQMDLASGESTTFQWRLLAGTGPVTLQWTANSGTVASDGTYTAPSSIPADGFDVVTACVQGTTRCDQERIGLHPFRLAPAAPVVASGQAVQLAAMQGGASISATWALGGPGTMGANGLYTAAAQKIDAGGIPVTATAGGVTESGLVGVTGQFPGMVNRIADYFEETEKPTPYGTYYNALGVNNTLLYANGVYGEYEYTPSGASSQTGVGRLAVDVYDLTDPVHPAWVNAFEPIVSGSFHVCGGSLYQVAGSDQSGGDLYGSGAIGVYDLSGATPVPVQKVLLPAWDTIVAGQSDCVVASLAASLGAVMPGSTPTLTVYSLQGGGIVTSDYAIPLTSLSGTGYWQVESLVSDGSRLYMDMFDPNASSQSYKILVFDLTASTPTLIGSTSEQYGALFSMALEGSELYGTIDRSPYPLTLVYEISGTTPRYLTQLEAGNAMNASGGTLLTTTGQQGLGTIDISNPEQPTMTSNLFDDTTSVDDAVLVGSYAYEAGYGTGIGVWDVSKPGGMLPTNLTPDDSGFFIPTALAGNATTVYAAGTTLVGDVGGIYRYDLTQNPPARVAMESQPAETVQALALSGTTLYEGSTTDLEVLDASGSGSPAPISSTAMEISALATSGNLLAAGTEDGHLVLFDISQPQTPAQVSSTALADVPYQIAFSGNFAVIADASGGLAVYDVSTPASPQLVSDLKQFPEVYGVALDGTLALLAAREYGLVIVDLTNPAKPVVVGKAALDTDNAFSSPSIMYNKAFTVAVGNQIAYIGVYNMDPDADAPDNGAAMIYGFDYSDPTHPRLVSLSSNGLISDLITCLWVSGTELVEGSTASLTALDVSQPQSTIGLFPLPLALRGTNDPGSIKPKVIFGSGGGSMHAGRQGLRWIPPPRFRPSAPDPVAPR